jgi:putative endonuclease
VATASGWWLYILECHSGVLYTGIAKDVDARFEAHLNGTGAMFTRLNRPVRILGRARLRARGEALSLEYAFKQLPRAGKLRWCQAGLDAFVRTERAARRVASRRAGD